MGRTIVLAELEQHSKEDDVWIVVDGEVYDMTAFAPTHPGGAESESPRNQLRAVARPRHELLANLPPSFPQVIYQYAGKDASAAYNEVHSPSLIRKHLGQTGLVGSFDASTMPSAPQASVANPIVADSSRAAGPAKPDLDDIINLDDFEKAAEQTLSKKAWAYIHGASNDNITRDANQHMYKRIWLRPAVMRDISVVDTSCELFGCRLSMPVYISPTGAVRMAGPEGEVGQAKAAATAGIIQCMSTPASYPHDEILAATKDQAFFQLYVNKNRAESEKLIRQVTSSGLVKAIFVTVDCPVISKREDDERVKADEKTGTTLTSASRVSVGKKDKKGSGLTRQNSNFIDSTLNWDDIAWLRSITNLPIVVKGIQRWEDAVMAMKWKCNGIVISNHGGRAADTSPPSILVLMELQKHCPQVFRSMKVLIDGGIRRGSDVVKALCLGASAVGIGRPFMYAVGYGQEGVEHLASMAKVLQEEIKVAMQLCGITNLAREASPSYVNTADLDHLVYSRHSSTLPLMDKIKGRL